MKQCAVTGGNGFVGSNVVRQLLERDYEVIALVGADLGLENLEGLPVKIREVDLLDAAGVRAALRGVRRVVHTAACYAFWSPDPGHVYRVNVLGTRHVMEAARDIGFEKVVHTSSIAAVSPGLGIGPSHAGDENSVLDLSRFRGHYKMSKSMAETVALRFAAQGLPVSIVYPTTVLGPGDRRPTPTGEMIVHYLNGHMKMYVALHQNLVDVRDVAVGHVLALERGQPGGRYVLGGDNLTMRELLDALAELTGIPAPRLALPPALLGALGRVNEWISDHVTGRPPLIPREAALHARDSRRVEPTHATRELGYRWRPARDVVAGAVAWFVAEGHCKPGYLRRIESHGVLRERLSELSEPA